MDYTVTHKDSRYAYITKDDGEKLTIPRELFNAFKLGVAVFGVDKVIEEDDKFILTNARLTGSKYDRWTATPAKGYCTPGVGPAPEFAIANIEHHCGCACK